MKKILSVVGLLVFALSLFAGSADAQTNRYGNGRYNGYGNCPMGYGQNSSWQGTRRATWNGNWNNCRWAGTGSYQGQFTPKRSARR